MDAVAVRIVRAVQRARILTRSQLALDALAHFAFDLFPLETRFLGARGLEARNFRPFAVLALALGPFAFGAFVVETFEHETLIALALQPLLLFAVLQHPLLFGPLALEAFLELALRTLVRGDEFTLLLGTCRLGAFARDAFLLVALADFPFDTFLLGALQLGRFALAALLFSALAPFDFSALALQALELGPFAFLPFALRALLRG